MSKTKSAAASVVSTLVTPKAVKVPTIGSMTQTDLIALIAQTVQATLASAAPVAAPVATPAQTTAPVATALRPFPEAGQRNEAEKALGRNAWTARCEAYKASIAGRDTKSMSYAEGMAVEKAAKKAASAASAAVFAAAGYKYVSSR